MNELALIAEEALAVAPSSCKLNQSIPILFFGDLSAYERSPLKIITVALNPSKKEFPDGNPWGRFPAAASYSTDLTDSERTSILIRAWSQYFDNVATENAGPYTSWFGHFDNVLAGFNASYYKGLNNVALHTDLLSPVATDPTWSKLTKEQQQWLQEDGGPIWHQLVEHLKPDIVLVSVASNYCDDIKFKVTKPWSAIAKIDGKEQYPIKRTKLQLQSGHTFDCLYAQAAQVPFGYFSHPEKQTIGLAVKGMLENW